MMFNLIRMLGKRHRLTVLSFYEQESELDYAPVLAKYCENLELLYRGQNFDVPDLLGLKPPEIVYEFYHQRMEDLVRRYLSLQEFDIMQCEFLQTAHYAKVDQKIACVLTDHEVLSMAYRKRFSQLSWTRVEKIKALTAWMRMLNYEINAIKRFSAVVVLTPGEADFLVRHAPGVSVFSHAMGVDCDYFEPGHEAPEDNRVVLVGNFRHSPNASGAMWLLEEVWPRLRGLSPLAHLEIVGADPTPAMRAWDGRDNVRITGLVDDIRPHLSRAAVTVAPVFEGAGMRTKVLEAWAMGRPVVGTQLAFEGLSATGPDLCLVADDADSFAARIHQLLQDRESAKATGARARQIAASSFSWDAFAQFYENIYAAILPSWKPLSDNVMVTRPACY
jgi:glycosyltransferase involved in cell wall biosynthesis